MPLEGWHPADIVAAVRKRGSNLAQLGLANGKAASTLKTALQSPRTPSNRIIADFIRVPMHVLWPAWFDRNGALKPSSRKKSASERHHPSSPKRRAA